MLSFMAPRKLMCIIRFFSITNDMRSYISSIRQFLRYAYKQASLNLCSMCLLSNVSICFCFSFSVMNSRISGYKTCPLLKILTKYTLNIAA